jgi:hypothetical protein
MAEGGVYGKDTCVYDSDGPLAIETNSNSMVPLIVRRVLAAVCQHPYRLQPLKRI